MYTHQKDVYVHRHIYVGICIYIHTHTYVCDICMSIVGPVASEPSLSSPQELLSEGPEAPSDSELAAAWRRVRAHAERGKGAESQGVSWTPRVYIWCRVAVSIAPPQWSPPNPKP